MESHSAEEAKKKYEKLPQEIKDILYSPNMSFVIQQIGEKNKLHIDQIDLLNSETGQLLLGFVEPKDFPATLMEMLNVEGEKADAIAQDINDLLLNNVRGAMKTTYEQNTVAPVVIDEKSVVMPSRVAAAPDAPVAPTPSPAAIPAPMVTTPPVSNAISNKPAAPVAPAPQSNVNVPVDMQLTTPAPQSDISVPTHEADVMFSESTVSLPLAAPIGQAKKAEPTPTTAATSAPKVDTLLQEAGQGTPPPPPVYKADPYREPIE